MAAIERNVFSQRVYIPKNEVVFNHLVRCVDPGELAFDGTNMFLKINACDFFGKKIPVVNYHDLTLGEGTNIVGTYRSSDIADKEFTQFCSQLNVTTPPHWIDKEIYSRRPIAHINLTTITQKRFVVISGDVRRPFQMIGYEDDLDSPILEVVTTVDLIEPVRNVYVDTGNKYDVASFEMSHKFYDDKRLREVLLLAKHDLYVPVVLSEDDMVHWRNTYDNKPPTMGNMMTVPFASKLYIEEIREKKAVQEAERQIRAEDTKRYDREQAERKKEREKEARHQEERKILESLPTDAAKVAYARRLKEQKIREHKIKERGKEQNENATIRPSPYGGKRRKRTRKLTRKRKVKGKQSKRM